MEKKIDYKSNGDYDPNKINKLIKIYRMASEAGDKETISDTYAQIYDHIYKYVYQTLWKHYSGLMKSEHREDVIQEIWLKIFSEIKNFDPDKGSITTFIAPWIKHVVSDYASKNFRNTTVYYANNIKKISGAQNCCSQLGLNPNDIEVLMQLTGLSEITVKNSIALIKKKDNVSYEALVDAGVDYRTSIKGPEEAVLEAESEKDLNELLDATLDDEERLIVSILLDPENISKTHSSYREIVQQIPGSNIPQIKKKVSKITAKLKDSSKFKKLYPYILAQEKALEDNYIPVMDNTTDEEMEMYANFEDEDFGFEADGWKKLGPNEV